MNKHLERQKLLNRLNALQEDRARWVIQQKKICVHVEQEEREIAKLNALLSAYEEKE